MMEILSQHRQIIFDRAFGQMLQRHFYLMEHRFSSFDRFEGSILTSNRHRYEIVVSSNFSCSCRRFRLDSVCKHFLFVLKRIFNVNLYSFDLRLAIMQYHQLTFEDLERIFQGQIRRVCPMASPTLNVEKLPLTLKRQSIDGQDVCPICFERLLLTKMNLVTCFNSCGKSIHEICLNEWKRYHGKTFKCPLCQIQWNKLNESQRAVLDYYAHRSESKHLRERYILCCLYTPPECC